jgi:hypothetical protein
MNRIDGLKETGKKEDNVPPSDNGNAPTATPRPPTASAAATGFPWLILPDPVLITECARNCFQGFSKAEKHFIRNGALVVPEETRDGLQLHTITEHEFASEIERAFRPGRLNAKNEPVQEPCDARTAKLLMNCREEIRAYGLPLRLLAASPVLVEVDRTPQVLGKGYHPHNGGIYVARELDLVPFSLEEAVLLLNAGLFSDYKWAAPSDLSRAVAQVLSPAMKLGNLLPGADFPLDLALGDASQSGKTHRMKFTALIYGEVAYTIVKRDAKHERGVGSLGESIISALLSGKLFILFDNIRGEFDSQLLENILRGTGSVAARVPYKAEVLTHTDRAIFQLTSNSAKVTQDLINRSLIINNIKQPDDYKDRAILAWGEGFIDEIKEQQTFFLSAVHAVLGEWIRRGKPATKETRHNFKAWVQAMDWIVQNLFGLPKLMDDHTVSVDVLTDKGMGWLREVVLEISRRNLQSPDKYPLPAAYRANDFRAICEEAGIEIPGGGMMSTTQNKRIGSILKPIFEAARSETVLVGRLQVVRSTEEGTAATDYKECYRYQVSWSTN